MATAFKRYTAVDVGTAAVTVIPAVAAGTTVVVIGMSLVNKTAGNVKASATAAGSKLIQNVTVPAETTGYPLDGKLVLSPADTLTVVADTATALDVIVSTMEIS